MANIKYGYGKYIWIIGIITLLGGSGLFAYLESIGLEITCEDKVCKVDEECLIECSVYNPTYKSQYLFNHDNWKITFSPDIVDVDLYVKYYGKWRYTNFTKETRFPNIPDARKYVFVFPKKATKYFQLRTTVSEPSKIKWNFGELDPIIVGYKYIYENLSDVVTNSTKKCTAVIDSKNASHTEDCILETTYKTEYYDGSRIGLNVGGDTYNTPNLNVNEKEGYLYICDVPVGKRNWEEYPMRQFEINKGVCKLICLI